MSNESGSVTDAGDPSTAQNGTRLRILSAHFGFTALLSILFLTFLDNTVISAVLANVQSALHEGVSDLQWVVGAYALTFASLMLISGSLSDNFGRKKVMLVGVGIFCAGSIVCALANSATMLVVGRVIMGVGAAASEPGTLSMIRHIYPDPRRRARALGVWAAVSGLALAMGPVLGGALTGFWSWHAIFWFNLAFGGLAFVAAAITLPESSHPTSARPDFIGFALGSLTIATATFATILGESVGYRTRWILTLYAVSIAALVTFIMFESGAKNPMLDLNFFRRRSFAGSTFVAFASYFSVFSIFFFVALYLEVVAMSGAYDLAEDFLPLLVGMVLASFFTGRWVGLVGSRVPMMTGCLVRGGRRGADRFRDWTRCWSGHRGLDHGHRRHWLWHHRGAGHVDGPDEHPRGQLGHGGVHDQHQSRAGRRRGSGDPGFDRQRSADGEPDPSTLAQVGIPPSYRQLVITAITTGTVANRNGPSPATPVRRSKKSSTKWSGRLRRVHQWP
jgi:multidrug resistance protein